MRAGPDGLDAADDVPALMRIAVIHWSRRELGGAETYLRNLLPTLGAAGHELALLSESDASTDRDPIALPSGAAEWCIERDGREHALASLVEWHPDVIFVHLLTRPENEAAVQGIAPSVLFAHGYLGTCISGTKTWKAPRPRPCPRALGWGCLAHYYPHRCGGLNPATMIRDFATNRKRQDLLPGYRAVITNSAHLAREYVANGCSADRVHAVPMPVVGEPTEVRTERTAPFAPDEWHLVFAGRMDRLKGGRVLIEALPYIVSALDRRVRVTFAGEGPDRARWELLAEQACDRSAGRLSITFAGWQSNEGLQEMWRIADLLVVPSQWPEPFGLVGPEAGLWGVPAAAFAVGGIPEWLMDGVNGALASGRPSTARGLADAVIRCLRDPVHYASLRREAPDAARRFNLALHVREVVRILEGATLGTQPNC